MSQRKRSTRETVCCQCGQPFQARIDKQPKYCSRECSQAAQRQRQPKKCAVCGKTFMPRWRVAEKACSTECSAKLRAATCQQRMLTDNPMASPTIRKKVSHTLRQIGHRPPQGGNGRLMPKAQAVLLQCFPSAVAEFSVGRWHIDVAFCEIKLAVECDGAGHRARAVKERDARKTSDLTSRGWTVLRFWNQQIMNETSQVVETIASSIRSLSV